MYPKSCSDCKAPPLHHSTPESPQRPSCPSGVLLLYQSVRVTEYMSLGLQIKFIPFDAWIACTEAVVKVRKAAPLAATAA